MKITPVANFILNAGPHRGESRRAVPLRTVGANAERGVLDLRVFVHPEDGFRTFLGPRETILERHVTYDAKMTPGTWHEAE